MKYREADKAKVVRYISKDAWTHGQERHGTTTIYDMYSNANTCEAILIVDRWNEDKAWQIVKLSDGYYLKQYMDGKQFGRGARQDKKFIEKVLNIKINYTKANGLHITLNY